MVFYMWKNYLYKGVKMKIIEDVFENINIDEDLVIALGTFDGVHRGHQMIINEAVNAAKKNNLKSAVMTFDVNPNTILFPEKKVKLITDNATKAEIIRNMGVDYLFFVKFDNEFAKMDCITFIKMLKEIYKARILVCGYNYTFGYKGFGNVKLLSKYEKIYGYKLEGIKRVTLNGQSISSSIIRRKLELGDIKEANLLLGYNLNYTGEVVRGKKLGRKLDFPTANIIIGDNLCLKNGVYITRTNYNGTSYCSISNVGHNPTFNCANRIIETHILDFNEDIYDKSINVQFLNFMRGEIKFNTIEDLKSRVLKDINTAREFFH